MGLIKDIKDIQQLSPKEMLQEYDIVLDTNGNVSIYINHDEELSQNDSIPKFIDIGKRSVDGYREYLDLTRFTDELKHPNFDWSIQQIYRAEENIINAEVKKGILRGDRFDKELVLSGYLKYKLIWERIWY